MIQDLLAVLGKHSDSPEFKAMLAKHFPDFKKFDTNNEYKDKKSKITLRIDLLTMYDDAAPITEDKNEFKYFIAFFFGKDNAEIPLGISTKDDEAIVLKKAPKYTFHNKVTEGGFFMQVNDLHYHFENYKMIVSFDPTTGKNYGHIGFHFLLKGMKF
jgi:hypothetical protein